MLLAATGMAELTGGLGFSSPEPLKGLSSLERLVIRRVPLHNTKGLVGCGVLQDLVLEQVDQLTEGAMR